LVLILFYVNFSLLFKLSAAVTYLCGFVTGSESSSSNVTPEKLQSKRLVRQTI